MRALICVLPGDGIGPEVTTEAVKVLDAVEPRTKGPGGGGIFPGFVGPARPQGHGETHVLRGAAVVNAGFLPRAQEALVSPTVPAPTTRTASSGAMPTVSTVCSPTA